MRIMGWWLGASLGHGACARATPTEPTPSGAGEERAVLDGQARRLDAGVGMLAEAGEPGNGRASQSSSARPGDVAEPEPTAVPESDPDPEVVVEGCAPFRLRGEFRVTKRPMAVHPDHGSRSDLPAYRFGERTYVIIRSEEEGSRRAKVWEEGSWRIVKVGARGFVQLEFSDRRMFSPNSPQGRPHIDGDRRESFRFLSCDVFGLGQLQFTRTRVERSSSTVTPDIPGKRPSGTVTPESHVRGWHPLGLEELRLSDCPPVSLLGEFRGEVPRRGLPAEPDGEVRLVLEPGRYEFSLSASPTLIREQGTASLLRRPKQPLALRPGDPIKLRLQADGGDAPREVELSLYACGAGIRLKDAWSGGQAWTLKRTKP